MYKLFMPSTKSVLVVLTVTLVFVSSMSFLAYQTDNYFGSGPRLDSYYPNNFVVTPDGSAYWLERLYIFDPNMYDLGDLNANKDAIRLAKYHDGKLKYYNLIDQAFKIENIANDLPSTYYSYLKMDNAGQELWVTMIPAYYNYLMFVMRIQISDRDLHVSMASLEAPQGYAFFEATMSKDGSNLYLSLLEQDLRELERFTSSIQIEVDQFAQIYPLSQQSNHSAVLSIATSSLDFEDTALPIRLGPIYNELNSKFPLQSFIENDTYPIDTVLNSPVGESAAHSMNLYLKSKQISRDEIVNIFSNYLPSPTEIELSDLHMLPGIFSTQQLKVDQEDNIFFSGRQVISGLNGSMQLSPADFFVYDLKNDELRSWDLSDLTRFSIVNPVFYAYDQKSGLILFVINNYDYDIRTSQDYTQITQNKTDLYTWYSTSDRTKLFVGWFNPFSANGTTPDISPVVYQPSSWVKISDINTNTPQFYTYLGGQFMEYDPRITYGARNSRIQIFEFQGQSYFNLAYSDYTISTEPVREGPDELLHLSLFSTYERISDLVSGTVPVSHEVLRGDGLDARIPRNGDVLGTLAIPGTQKIDFLYFYQVLTSTRDIDFITSDKYILILDNEEVSSL